MITFWNIVNSSSALVTSVAVAAPAVVSCTTPVCSGSSYNVSSNILPSNVFTHPNAAAVSGCCPTT